MANPERGEFEFEVEGKKYRMKLTLDAIAQLEDYYEQKYRRPIPFGQILARVQSGSIGAMRAVIWASLQCHHPDLTVKQTGELIDQAGGILAFAAQIGKLIGTAQPDVEDVQAAGGMPPNPRKAPAGRNRHGGRSTGRRGALA